MKKLAGGLLAICGLLQAGPAAAELDWEFEPLAPGSVVAVALADADFVYSDHVWPGVVIAPDGWVLVSEKAVSEQFLTAVVERPGDTVEAIDAEIVAILEPFHVALLHAPGLTRPAAGLNVAGAILREPVTSYGWDDAICAVELCGDSRGVAGGPAGRVLRQIDCPFEDEACWMYIHEAEIPPYGNGGPLANSCGEVVGINVVGPEHVPEELGGPVWYAVRLAEILHVLEGLGVPYVASEEPCVVPGEVVAAKARVAARATAGARVVRKTAARVRARERARAKARAKVRGRAKAKAARKAAATRATTTPATARRP